MDLFQRYGNLFKSDGTNQLQRTLPALEHDYILPDERDESQLLDYARGVAGELRFHSLAGQAVGKWTPMFEQLLDSNGDILTATELEKLKTASGQWSPHLALLFAFLRIFSHLQVDLNELPARHLAYYFGRFLQILRKTAIPDKLHVVFELARNSVPYLLPAGTLLDAGKDTEGRTLSYALEREVIVSHASIDSVWRLVAEHDRFGRRRFFKSEKLPEEGSWHTFGCSQFGPTACENEMTEVDQGFALASPLFRMAEGTRRITINGELNVIGTAPVPQNLGLYMRIEITGEEGWFEPQASSVELVSESGQLHLVITAEISESQSAVIDFDGTLHMGLTRPETTWPLLRCLVQSDSGHFDTFDGLSLVTARIDVSVSGVQNLVFQNDQGNLVPGKPLPLFGARPGIGSSFYIGSQEVFSKRLTGLTLNLDWQNLPPDLLNHYAQYFDDTIDDNLRDIFLQSFDVLIDLLDGRSWSHRLAAPLPLFEVDNSQTTLAFGETAFTSAFSSEQPYAADPELANVRTWEASTSRGFLRVQLNGPGNDDLVHFDGTPYAREVPFRAFGHEMFSRRYAMQALALARWETGDLESEPVLPNEPYTPTLAGLTLDYSSSEEFSVTNVQAHERFYSISPFGHTTANAEITARLVPEFSGSAALYLGVKKLKAPAGLAMLFQLDEGTATVADLLRSADVRWSYLSGDRWLKLSSAAVTGDETLGFQTSGVVSLVVASDATTRHTAMPEGLTWLQAQIDKSPHSAARTLSLQAQAATAVFSPETGELLDYAGHLAEGVDAKTVSKLKTRVAAIKKVEQPYASFGGQEPETDHNYFQRTSERLRHRNRAVTPWDFERLILNHFSDVFKVKCLAHRDESAIQKSGDVALVIVPNLLNSQSSNRLEPRAGEVLMEDIRRFIAQDMATPFANVHVIHPVYEQILVEAKVAFREGYDPGYYAGQLNEDLQRFLSPWAFEEGQDIVFGSRIYKSELLKFMEDREYVDYITLFNLYHSFEGEPRYGIGFMEIGVDFIVSAAPKPAIEDMRIGVDFVVGRGVELAISTQPHTVLVSHSRHRIEPVIPGTEICTGVSQLGVGYMTVGLDFEVLDG